MPTTFMVDRDVVIDSMCSGLAGSPRWTVRPCSDWMDTLRIPTSNPIRTVEMPRASRRVQRCSAMPQPSSVTTTVPSSASVDAIDSASSTSICQRRQPSCSTEVLSIGMLVSATGMDAVSGSGVVEPPFILTM